MIDLTPLKKEFASAPLAILGLGQTGWAVYRSAMAAGIDAHVWDDSEDKRTAAQEKGLTLVDFAQTSIENYAALIPAPGIPLTHPRPHPAVTKAKEADLPVYGDVELLHKLNHGRPVIGITGTNGKSTTTALIGHILEQAGISTATGGNLGRPVMDLDMPDEDGVFVLELSSYQLDLCQNFAPDIAVWLNFSADHLDRHGDIDGYWNAKSRIMRGDGSAVIGVDDAHSKKLYETIENRAPRIPVSLEKALSKGIALDEENRLISSLAGREKMEPTGLKMNDLPSLRGRHNWQNAACAYGACRLWGLERDRIIAGMKSFPGLPHRQYLVRVINGVSYVNDSKATNAAATATALRSFNPIYWILGGRPKEGGLKGLEEHMNKIRHAFVIGEAEEDFCKWLKELNVPHTACGKLDAALPLAHEIAQKERSRPGGPGVVLFSPACASFDQFENFEARGDYFAQLVHALPKQDDQS